MDLSLKNSGTQRVHGPLTLELKLKLINNIINKVAKVLELARLYVSPYLSSDYGFQHSSSALKTISTCMAKRKLSEQKTNLLRSLLIAEAD